MRKGKKLLFGNIWKYVLVAVVVIFIWSAVFESLGQIKDNQRLTISVYNIDCDTQALRDELAVRLPELTKQEILELYVDNMEHIPNQTYATQLLSMQLMQSDLIIMPESLLNKLEVASYFPELPAEIQNDQGYDYYQADGICYGILLGSMFTEYCQTEEPCYLLLSGQSVNLGGILDRGDPADDAGLKVLEYLVKEDAK